MTSENKKTQPVYWQPHEGPQTEALQRAEFEILYGGARGGGKTEAGLAWLVEPEYLSHPNYRALVIRKNVEDLRDWVDRAKNFYRPLGVKAVGNPIEFRFPSGAVIRTGHLKDEGAYEKYQGHEYQKILVEELTQISEEVNYLKLVSSCRSTIGLTPQVFCTTNPGGPGHEWVRNRWVDVAREKTFLDKTTKRTRIFIPAKVTDNPTLIDKDPNYVGFLDGLPEDLRKAWRDGDWDVFAGQFFKKWRRDVHVIPTGEIPEGWFKYRAIDYGYAAPFCCLWFAVDYDYNVIVYREHYEAEKELSYHIERIKELSVREDYRATLADPAMWAKNPVSSRRWDVNMPTHRSIAQLMSSEGIYVAKANNERMSGWSLVREYLEWEGPVEKPSRRPKLFVMDNCVNLIRTFPKAVYDKHKTEDLDTKGEDHALDALRYGMMHAITPKKENVKPWIERELDKLDALDNQLWIQA